MTTQTITNEMMEEFLGNGKGALAGSFIPVPDAEELSALVTIQYGFDDKHMKASGLSGVSIADGSIDPSKMGNMELYAFTGHNLAGACTLTGAKVGDIVINLINLTTPANVESSFESVITVNDQIQQTAASDLSAVKFLVLLITPLSFSKLKLFSFTGHNLAGACTLVGAHAGDVVVGVVNLTTPATAAASFEATISVDGQIQQTAASDLSTSKFLVLLI